MRMSVSLAALCVICASAPARSEDEGVFSHCNRFAGGTFTEERADRWREHGYRIELKDAIVNVGTDDAVFAMPAIRHQVDTAEQIEDPISWSAWTLTKDFDEVGGELTMQTRDVLWVLRAESGRLVGRQFLFPVIRDRETRELKSLAQDGELGITLECVRKK